MSPRRIALFVAIPLLSAIVAVGAGAQCLLANPSFEVAGAGTAFGGWSSFGPVAASTNAPHGHRAARVWGPDTGTWNVSGVWQGLDTAPGDRWQASVQVWNASSAPLQGGSQALLNVEWRSATGTLLSYESHAVATAASPRDEWIRISLVSAAAPTGATQARLLLGVLQGPTDPQPVVMFDAATFELAGPPTPEDLQWSDFPTARSVAFSGRNWRVKGPGWFGPGPNLFSDGTSAVNVDASGRLHLTLQQLGGQWYSSEVALEEPLGYGDYRFTTVGRLDHLDPAVVFGLFLWEYGRCYDPAFLWWNPFNEVDIEFSRWGDPQAPIAQFVAQPFDWTGNLDRFDVTFGTDERTTHAFRWLADRVEFRSWRGGPFDESPANLVHSWSYAGPHVPRPESPRVHLNLWRFADPPAAPQEVVLEAFTFVPEGAVLEVPGSPREAREVAVGPARPNPFAGSTRIRFSLVRADRVEVTLHDASGRRVRGLAAGTLESGAHELTWDGCDDVGRRLAPGVYWVRVRAGGLASSRRLVRLE